MLKSHTEQSLTSFNYCQIGVFIDECYDSNFLNLLNGSSKQIYCSTSL